MANVYKGHDIQVNGIEVNTSIPEVTDKEIFHEVTESGQILLGKTTKTETTVDCPTCGKAIRWQKYYRISGHVIPVMLTYCKCEWQGKRKRRGVRL